MTAIKALQQQLAPARRRRFCFGLVSYSSCFAFLLRKRAGTKLMLLASLLLIYLTLFANPFGRWFRALRASLVPPWELEFATGEKSDLSLANKGSSRRPVAVVPHVREGVGGVSTFLEHDPLSRFMPQWAVLNLHDPAHKALLERLSTYRLSMFLDEQTRRPLFDPDPNPAAQVALGDFPWVGVSLTQKEKRKFKPPRLLGSILRQMPDPWEVYPNPSSLDTIISIPDVTSSRYAAKEEPLVAGHPPRLLPVSAILVKEPGKGLESVKLVISQLAKYPYFREVLIWNNDPYVEISSQDFEIPNTKLQPPIRVFNSSDNLGDLGKYLACNMAMLGTCYFQDSGLLNGHMDTLYTSYIRFPHLVHAGADRVSLVRDRRWTFTSSTNLHAGFAALDYGAFVPKSAINRFLRQTGWAGLPRERLERADSYFTIWLNQYALQLEVPLVSLGRRSTTESPSRVPEYALDAARILERTLRLDPQNLRQDPFLRNELGPPWNKRDARTACHNDACIFLTSMDALPSPPSVPFVPGVSSMTAHEEKFQILPAVADHASRFSYRAAVDGDPTTCWSSGKAPAAGDFFGLHFVMPQICEILTISGSAGALERDVMVEVSIDGVNWTTCRHFVQNDGETIALALECEDAEVGSEEQAATQLKTFLRVVALRDLATPLEICSMRADGMAL